MHGIRNTYLHVCGSQRLLDIRRTYIYIYTSAGLNGFVITGRRNINQKQSVPMRKR